jgi:hypothetical protein
MFNIQKHLRHAILAVGLAAASLTASANVLPTYHIGVPDTMTADIAFIDFVFSSFTGAAPATATLSNFTGTPLAEGDISGFVSATSNGFSFGNATGLNELYIGVNGPFAFDLNFSEGFLGVNTIFGRNSNFTIALYDSSENLIGETDSALNFTLSKSGVAFAKDSSLLSLELIPAAVVAVPEPADWALMLTGLVLVVSMTRLNGRANARRLAAA